MFRSVFCLFFFSCNMAWNRVIPINLSLVVFSSVVKRITRHENTVIFEMSMGSQIALGPLLSRHPSCRLGSRNSILHSMCCFFTVVMGRALYMNNRKVDRSNMFIHQVVVTRIATNGLRTIFSRKYGFFRQYVEVIRF